jgi:hypothetical protein
MSTTDLQDRANEPGASPSADADRRAREARIARRWASFHEQMAILDEIIGEWRAKGILPPEEPRRRV